MDQGVISQILGFVVFIFSIIVHENAHGIAAEHFGDPTARAMGRITMNPVPHIDPVGSILLPAVALISGIPMIGWAKPVPVDGANLRNPVRDGAWVAAAGPISNFILAFIAAILWIIVRVVFMKVPGLMENASVTLTFFDSLFGSMIVFNCVLAVFNLLPIPPLDGHWILMRFLPDNARVALASIGRFGFIVLLLMLWTGALWWIIGPAYKTAVGIYLGMVNGVVRLF